MLMGRLGMFFCGINKRPFLPKCVLTLIHFNIEIWGVRGDLEKVVSIGTGVYLSRPGIKNMKVSISEVRIERLVNYCIFLVPF